MLREYIMWLRGDAKADAFDIYNHIQPEDVKEAYRLYSTPLGI